jgi:DNA-binding NarL/FixJ family response regulator
MIKILIADDHAIVRSGLKQIVAETTDIIVSDEASTGQEVLKKVRSNKYDIVVLDISLPDKDGLDILKQIRKEKPNLAVLVLSMHPEEQYAVRVLNAGGAGYLTKESAPDELITALRRVSAGRRYISNSLAELLVLELKRNADRPLYEILSDREYQVMCKIASGRTVKEIAGELSLSVKTVSTYRSRILAKMRMANNAELTRYAIKHGLVD